MGPTSGTELSRTIYFWERLDKEKISGGQSPLETTTAYSLKKDIETAIF